MGKIIAIGGGEITGRQTESIDRFVIEQSGKSNPTLLFLSTASHDSKSYIKTARDYFSSLGCNVTLLRLCTGNPPDALVRERILSADIVYVGGGDTVRMMERWRQFGVDECLKEAYDAGVVLSGLSAGSICWFRFGHSDSDSFLNKGQWDYIRAYGLGIIPAAHCPHYDEPGREGFDEMMRGETIPGIALENCAALVWEDGACRILKSHPDARAFLLRSDGEILRKEELFENTAFTL